MTQPVLFQRVEAGILLASAIFMYQYLGGPWLIFGLAFLIPDITAWGYQAGNKVGAASYNISHSLALPLVLLTGGLLTNQPLAQLGALIWFAHIGFDRMLGFGLKENSGFKDTHLGRIGHKS